MKEILISMLMLVLSISVSQAQSSQTNWAIQYLAFRPDSLNPGLELTQMDSAINILYPDDSSECGPRRAFERYKEFAEHRLPNAATPVSFARAYSEALLNARQFNGCTGSYNGSFTNIGPKNFKEYQNQGWVSDIWVNPLNDSDIIIGSENGGLFRSYDGGDNWTNISDSAPSVGSMGINSFAVNPNSYRLACLSSIHGRRNLAFQVSPSDPTIAYQIIRGNVRPATLGNPTLQWRLARGINNKPPSATPSWCWSDRTELLNSFVPSGNYEYRYSGLAIDPKDANRLFVSYSLINRHDPGKHRVHVSNDGGQTFVDMSTGLPELPVNCLVYQNGSDDVLYAGTDDGVYYWDKPQLCWIRMGNLPSCVVQSLKINYSCGKLLVATYGRGMWEGDLYQHNGIAPVTGITNTSGETSNTNQFMDGSILVEP